MAALPTWETYSRIPVPPTQNDNPAHTVRRTSAKANNLFSPPVVLRAVGATKRRPVRAIVQFSREISVAESRSRPLPSTQDDSRHAPLGAPVLAHVAQRTTFPVNTYGSSLW